MSSWRPLLEGELAERAWEAVDSITQILTSAAASMPPPPADGTAPAVRPATGPVAETPEADRQAASEALEDIHPNVAGGIAGRALFFAYRSRSGNDRAANGEIASNLLERATEALATVPLLPDLYGGFSGIAWTAEHLYGPRFADAGEQPAAAHGEEAAAGGDGAAASGEAEGDPLIEIDEALVRYLEHTPWTADYDLIRGLTGLGVYALERLPRPSALTCLARVLDRLEDTSEGGAHGLTWHTSPELLPDWQRETFPTGYYNLGVAHGVPGTIAMLGAASAAAGNMARRGDKLAGEVAGRARKLVDGAVRWLMTQRLPDSEEAWFGSSFSPEVKATNSRLAWCYGDPGIAAALLLAARACREEAWETFAIDLALHSAQRSAGTAMVRDAGICHGSAGLAHLFNRLYQETGEARFAAASRRWFGEALDFRQPGLGVAGYRAFAMTDDMQSYWRCDAGFLEGVSGIGLALLGAVSDFEPAWDRILALSAPIEPGGA